MTLLTAKEWIGIALTLLVSAMTILGDKIMKFPDEGDLPTHDTEAETEDSPNANGQYDSERDRPTLERNTERPPPPDKRVTFQDFVQVMEQVLGFYSWYNSGGNFHELRKDDGAGAMLALRVMLTTIKEKFPRMSGNGWKLQKFHEILHIVDSILLFGSPSNWDAGIGERGLKDWAKIPSGTAQRRGQASFNLQTALRNAEAQAMKTAMAAMGIVGGSPRHRVCGTSYFSNNVTSQAPEQLVIGLPKFRIQFMTGTGQATGEWLGKRKQRGHVEVHPLLLDFFTRLNKQRDVGNNGEPIMGFTEYRRSGILFRAHPNYRSEGPFYDWANIQWEGYDELIPAKILAFFQYSHRTEETFAVVHSAKEKLEHNSVFVTRWEMDYTGNTTITPKLFVVPADSIEERIFAVEELPGLYQSVTGQSNIERARRVLVISKMQKWSSEFY